MFAHSLRLGQICVGIITRFGRISFGFVAKINMGDHVDLGLLEAISDAISFVTSPDDGTQLMFGGKVQSAIMIVARAGDEGSSDCSISHGCHRFESGICGGSRNIRDIVRKQLFQSHVTLGIQKRLTQMGVDSHIGGRVFASASFRQLHRGERFRDEQ